MSGKPTIHTVARAAGVSTSTVSQVLRGRGRISGQTRDKVMQTVERLHYVHDRRAAAMRSGESRDVGLLIHNFANPFNAEVVVSVNDSLQELGYLVFVLDGRDEPERQFRYLQTMIGGAPGGLLWVPAKDTDEQTVDFVRSHSGTTVTLLRPVTPDSFDHVGMDNVQGTMLATRHLTGLGHRKIAFLGGDFDSGTINQRIAGYMTALMEVGEQPVVRSCAEKKATAMEATISLLSDHPDITGIVCNCDVVAMGAALGLDRLGLKPGADVSIVGFDGVEDARLWSPPLTTIAVDPTGIGRQLAEAFLSRKQNPDAAVRSITIPVRLQEGATSGPPRRPSA